MIDAASIVAPALVYVRTNGRINAEVWREALLDLAGYYKGRIVAAHPLPADQAMLSIKTLKQIYPPPAVAEEII